MRSSAGSRQAQAGALALQMLALGRIDEASSSVPTRTTVRLGRPVESANRCEPHSAQKRRVTRLPLSATRSWLAIGPDTLIEALGKIAFTVPLEAMRWQSRHQQTRAATGSAVMR